MSRDIYAGVFVLALAGLYWLGADAIHLSPLIGRGVGEQSLPKLLAVALAALAVLLIVQTVLARRRLAITREAARGSDPARMHKHWRALGMFLIGIGYLLVVDTIGYMPALALLIAVAVMYNGRRLSREVALAAVAGAALFYIIFVRLLGIPLPAGIWPDLWARVAG